MRSDEQALPAFLAVIRAHFPAISALTGQELAALRQLRSRVRRLRRGEDLFVQGRRHDGIFLIVEGLALRYRILADGRRQVLDVCLPGDILGSSSCFLGSALDTATALTRVAVAFASSTEIIGVFDRFPGLTQALFRSATCEAARLGEHLIDVGRRGVRQRVAHFLLELGARLEVIGLATSDSFTMPITQVQLADILGLSITHTNRVLRRLREDGLLDLNGTRIHIRDRGALADLAEFTATYLDRHQNSPIPESPFPALRAPGSTVRLGSARLRSVLHHHAHD